MTWKVLIADDEPEMLRALKRIFSRKGCTVVTAQCGEEALKHTEETMFDLIISDMAMEDLSGLELLKIVAQNDPTIPFIIITGVGTIESAVEAIQMGAFHYITKPFKSQDIEILAQRALEYGRLNRQIKKIRVAGETDAPSRMLIGQSRPMQDLMNHVEKITDSTASVLITGETGTGKSLLAETIHDMSARKNKPFLTIDCAALPQTLLESELFGHVKGAFTGAINAKRGLLEEAQGGTVFLDEISEIATSTQVKLLRAIQEGVIKPVGSNNFTKIDVRFLSATSRDLQKELQEGGFREELYYRLAVIPVTLPPLRERRQDIPLLIDHFLNRFCKKYNKKITHIHPDVLDSFMNANWKGNIRELANILERAVLLSENSGITQGCIFNTDLFSAKPTVQTDAPGPLLLKEAVMESEKRTIKRALRKALNNRSEAARLLGISRRALYDKMDAYGLGKSPGDCKDCFTAVK
jgi:DNA-binding NtrC family response regulator